jgi:hypothetical protein
METPGQASGTAAASVGQGESATSLHSSAVQVQWGGKGDFQQLWADLGSDGMLRFRELQHASVATRSAALKVRGSCAGGDIMGTPNCGNAGESQSAYDRKSCHLHRELTRTELLHCGWWYCHRFRCTPPPLAPAREPSGVRQRAHGRVTSTCGGSTFEDLIAPMRASTHHCCQSK